MLTGAETVSEPSPDLVAQLRESLLWRAGEYARLTGLALGTVSDRCAGDGKFLAHVQAGRNFTVERYQKAMDWLEHHWPASRNAAVSDVTTDQLT